MRIHITPLKFIIFVPTWLILPSFIFWHVAPQDLIRSLPGFVQARYGCRAQEFVDDEVKADDGLMEVGF